MSLKITFPLLISLIGVNSLANYNVIYPVKFVNFTNVVKWDDTDSQYSDWKNVGSPSNCKIQTPLENTVTAGHNYEKTLSKCDITQERIETKYVVRKDTGETKPNGTVTETRLFTDYTYKIQSVGTMPTEECRYSKSGSQFYWYDISRAAGAIDGKGSKLLWDGVQVKNTVGVGGLQPTEFIVDSYKYKRSSFQYKTMYDANLWYNYYEICRISI